MKNKNILSWITFLIVILTIIAAGVGLFWQGNGDPYPFTSVTGEEVTIFGQGIYKHDSVILGAGNRGADFTALFIGIPLLILCTHLYKKGSLGGKLLINGIYGYFLYLYGTLALSMSYNSLFLVYIAIFSLSFYGFILTYIENFKGEVLGALSLKLPNKRIATIVFTIGILTSFVWLEAPIGGLITGKLPMLNNSNTLFTHAFDLAVVIPALFISGIMIIRRKQQGYVIVFPILFLTIMLAPLMMAMTYYQLLAGITFTLAEVIIFIASFILLGLIAGWALVDILKGLKPLVEKESI